MLCKRWWAPLVMTALCLTGCRGAPTHNPLATWVPSPNFDQRKASMIVLHYTAEANVQDALHTLRARNGDSELVSAHYLIGNNGRIYQLVANGDRAWQAGKSWWGLTDDVNSRSIGIELDNDGHEPYPQAQINSLLKLLTRLTANVGIPRTAIVGHADVAPTRRADPGVFFPWDELAKHGFGLWYDSGPLPSPPKDFNDMMGLRLIGYDVTNPTAATIAFNRHYRSDDSNNLDARDERIIWDLDKKIMEMGKWSEVTACGKPITGKVVGEGTSKTCH